MNSDIKQNPALPSAETWFRNGYAAGKNFPYNFSL